jgi:hypothetical protein
VDFPVGQDGLVVLLNHVQLLFSLKFASLLFIFLFLFFLGLLHLFVVALLEFLGCLLGGLVPLSL